MGYLNDGEEHIVRKSVRQDNETTSGELICTNKRLIYLSDNSRKIRDISLQSISMIEYNKRLTNWRLVGGIFGTLLSILLFFYGENLLSSIPSDNFDIFVFVVGFLSITSLIFGLTSNSERLTVHTPTTELTFIPVSDESLKPMIHAIREAENDQHAR